jgi:hypothetical protein
MNEFIARIIIVCFIGLVGFVVVSIAAVLTHDQFKYVVVPKHIHVCKAEFDVYQHTVTYLQYEFVDIVLEKSNPILNYFGLLRFDKNKDKFKSIHIWLGNEKAIRALKNC